MAEEEIYPRYPRRPAAGVNWPFIALLVLLSGLTWRMLNNRQLVVHNPQAAPRPIVARGDLAEDEKVTIEIFRQAAPSVVHITTLTLQRDIFNTNVTEVPQGTGSGFIWSADGYVVTNFHVIQKAQRAKVTLSNNSTWDAELVGVAPDQDLAVLKLSADGQGLQPLAIGTSADLQVGQKVFAIGNPFGLDHTLTTGIISGLGREIRSLTDRAIQGVIQTDAAINPGNSGGPMLDSAGRLIGVTSAIYSSSGSYAGIGFAIPVDTVNRIVPQLIRNGKIEQVGLGIRFLADRIAQQYNLEGVVIMGFTPGSPAQKAGMIAATEDPHTGEVQLGDIIVAVDGQPIKTSQNLFDSLGKHSIGDTVKLVVRRNNSEKTLEVTLQQVQ